MAKPFIDNAWYAAGWSHELTPNRLLATTLLNRPVVLFRQPDGTPAALEDLCPHRFLPLSMGELKDGGRLVQCGYHGLTFDAQGRCVRVPGQHRIPPAARVRSYPAREHMGLIWLWPGEPERANRSALFDLPQYRQRGWGVGYGDALRIDAHYLNLADNLCDPAHVSFVHKTTLGSAAGEDIPVRSERRGNTVLTYRWTLNSEPVGFFKAFGNFNGRVDRWQYYYLHAPSTAIIDFGSIVAGSIDGPVGADLNAVAARLNAGVRVFSCHFLTPETEQSTVDYWLHVRNFAADDAAVSAAISDQFRVAFAEDKTILEAAQKRANQFPQRRPVNIASDAGAARLRQIIDEL